MRVYIQRVEMQEPHEMGELLEAARRLGIDRSTNTVSTVSEQLCRLWLENAEQTNIIVSLLGRVRVQTHTPVYIFFSDARKLDLLTFEEEKIGNVISWLIKGYDWKINQIDHLALNQIPGDLEVEWVRKYRSVTESSLRKDIYVHEYHDLPSVEDVLKELTPNERLEEVCIGTDRDLNGWAHLHGVTLGAAYKPVILTTEIFC